ncbi:hypothetical protein [Polaromonas sp.]|uniref:hypothetical protein n=1 Tax=Polaromonas sp. TaxID=1869339 RepID=UPI00326640AE
MREWIRILGLILLAMFVNRHVNAQSVYAPGEVGKIVLAAYNQNDFSTLDKLATKLRTEKSRTSYGRWNLSDFYDALYRAMLEGREDNSSEQWSKAEGKINRWVAISPQSSTAPIALGTAQTWHAWALRGNGYANTVTPKGWEDLAKHMAIARNTLEANKRISSDDPQWYVVMLHVALAESWKRDQYMALYEEAISKEPLYYDTHLRALERFTPRWGGDIQEIQQFAAIAVKRTAAAEGQALYAHVYWSAVQDIGFKALFAEPYRSSIWVQMKSGFEDVLKKYPDDWNRNVYARMACQMGEVDLFISLARQFNGEPIKSKSAWPGDYFQKCKEYAAALRPNNPL